MTFESFETATLSTSTSVSFAGGTFSCVGTTYCPGFFGISTATALDGVQSVYFASPDSAVFTFNTAINAFEIAIGGAGDVAQITLAAQLSNGDSTNALTDYNNANGVFAGNTEYFGIIDSVPFTSVTFVPSDTGDGIFFDSMYYGTVGAASTPEPSSVALLGIGLIGVGLRLRSKVRG